MARDETARERDPDQPLLARRSYLRLAGAAAASVAVAGASGTADAAGHDTIPVPADETRSTETGSDETSENGSPAERDRCGSDPEIASRNTRRENEEKLRESDAGRVSDGARPTSEEAAPE